jgi:hypothetical protein
MTTTVYGVLFLLVALFQSLPHDTPVPLKDEPHHHLLLENQSVRVFRLTLQPNEATLRHRHNGLFISVALRPATVANEVRGRQPIITNFSEGEVHSSRGAVNITERNNSAEPIDILVIEPTTPSADPTAAPPLPELHLHSAAIGDLLSSNGIRGYVVRLAADGDIERRREEHGSLIVALDDLDLQDEAGEPNSREIRMKTGDVLWVPPGTTHATRNMANAAISYLTFVFADHDNAPIQ